MMSASVTSSKVARKAATRWVGRSEIKPTVSDRIAFRPDGSIERTNSDYFGPGDFYNSAWHFFELLAPNPEDIEPTEGLSDQKV